MIYQKDNNEHIFSITSQFMVHREIIEIPNDCNFGSDYNVNIFLFLVIIKKKLKID
jgi:hypothetical protein